MFRFSLLFIFLGCFLVSVPGYSDEQSGKGQIQISLSNLPDESKGVLVFIYRNKDSFLKKPDERFYFKRDDIIDKHIVLNDIYYGDMTLSVIADINGNQELDTRIFGIPAEPVAFAENPKPRFGPPKYEKRLFPFQESILKLEVQLVSI